MDSNTKPDHVIDFMMSYITNSAASFIHAVYQGLAHYLQEPIMLASTLLIVMIGLGIAGGYIEASRKTLIFTITKMAVVISLGLHWDFFTSQFMNVLMATTTDIQKIIISAVPIKVPGAIDAKSALQLLADQIYTMGHVLFGVSGIVSKVEAIGVWILGALFVAIAAFEMILASVGSALLFSLAPLICLFWLAPFFKSIFERWVGMLIGFMFFNIMIVAVITLVTNMMAALLPGGGDPTSITAKAMEFYSFELVLLISLFILLKIENIGMSLGGGISLGSGTMMIVTGVVNIKGALFGAKSGGEGMVGKAGQVWSKVRSLGKSNTTALK